MKKGAIVKGRKGGKFHVVDLASLEGDSGAIVRVVDGAGRLGRNELWLPMAAFVLA